MTVEWSSYREFAPWTPTVEIRTPSEGGVTQINNVSHWFEYTDDRKTLHLFIDKKIELIVRQKQMANDKFFYHVWQRRPY